MNLSTFRELVESVKKDVAREAAEIDQERASEADSRNSLAGFDDTASVASTRSAASAKTDSIIKMSAKYQDLLSRRDFITLLLRIASMCGNRLAVPAEVSSAELEQSSGSASSAPTLERGARVKETDPLQLKLQALYNTMNKSSGWDKVIQGRGVRGQVLKHTKWVVVPKARPKAKQ